MRIIADCIPVPLPIFVELEGLVGTVRLRLQMSPEPPFLKALTFTLMGLPHVQAGCVPMFETGINILNLPLISKFVNYAIGERFLSVQCNLQLTACFRCCLQRICGSKVNDSRRE